MSGVLYLDNSSVIELVGLKNSVTGTADVGASVSVTLLDSSGAQVSGETWPLTMAHVADGLYRATMSSAINLSALTKYTAMVDVVGSGGEVGNWQCKVLARARGCC